MLLIKTDVSVFVIIVHAISVHCYHAECNNASSSDIGCLNANRSQEKATSVLRKCCPSGSSYVSSERTCREKNETAEIDASVFDNLDTRIAAGFDGIAFGMPNCSEVLVDFVITPDSFKEIANKEYASEMICVDREADDDSLIVKRCLSSQEYCKKLACVRKCCLAGRNMQGRSCALNDSGRGFKPTIYDLIDKAKPREVEDRTVKIGIMSGNCPGKKYPVKTSFYIAPNGEMHVPDKNKIYNHSEYCLEDVYFPDRKMDGIVAFLCVKKENHVDPQKITTQFVFKLIGLITSCIFLFATLLVYAMLPDLQNIHGLTLMCEAASFLLAYLTLLCIQLTFGSKDVNRSYCYSLACTLYFSILAAFTWMNIMSFDIWWTIGGVWNAHSSRGKKRLAWYSLYGWGCPILLTMFAIGVDKLDSLSSVPVTIKPGFGTDTCWFPSKATKSMSELVYFIIPMTLSILCNIVLFVLTVRSLLKVKKEITRVENSSKQHSERKLDSDRKSLVITIKLFVVMGVSWLAEGVAYFSPEGLNAWFYIPDTFNTLRGVLIFVIFVCKKSVYNALVARLGCSTRGKKGLRSSGTGKSSRDTSTPPTCFSTEDETHI